MKIGNAWSNESNVGIFLGFLLPPNVFMGWLNIVSFWKWEFQLILRVTMIMMALPSGNMALESHIF